MPLRTAVPLSRLRLRERVVALSAIVVLTLAVGVAGTHHDASPFVVGTTPPQQPFAAAGSMTEVVEDVRAAPPKLVDDAEDAVRFVGEAEDLSLARTAARTRDADLALALLDEYDARCGAGYAVAMAELTAHLQAVGAAEELPTGPALAPAAAPLAAAAATFAGCADHLALERSGDPEVQASVDALAAVFDEQATALSAAAGAVAAPETTWTVVEVGDAVADAYDRLQDVHGLRLAVLDAVIAG